MYKIQLKQKNHSWCWLYEMKCPSIQGVPYYLHKEDVPFSQLLNAIDIRPYNILTIGAPNF